MQTTPKHHHGAHGEPQRKLTADQLRELYPHCPVKIQMHYDGQDWEGEIIMPDDKLWAVVELFGHTVIVGSVSKVEPFGSPMVQVDVPATDLQPTFTKQFGPAAIYGITYVSKEIALATAREIGIKPITVYVPEIDDLNRLLEENKRLRKEVRHSRMIDADDEEGNEYGKSAYRDF